MRPTDLLVLPLAAMWQQKLRTLLTTLGVVFGAFVLAASLSIGQGVQETIDRESRRNDVSRKITVFPQWKAVESKAKSEVKVEGTMTEERRERIRKTLEAEKQDDRPLPLLREISIDRIKKLAALPHVDRVIPTIRNTAFAMLGNKVEPVGFSSGRPDDEHLRKRIIAGRTFDAPDQRAVVVSEMYAYHMGLVNDSDLEQLVGKPLRLELRSQKDEPGFNLSINSVKMPRNQRRPSQESRDEQAALGQLAAQLPGALDRLDLTPSEIELLRKGIRGGEPSQESEVHTQEFRVVGVYRQPTEAEQKDSWDRYQNDSALILPYQAAADFYFQEPSRREQGANQAILIVDSEMNVKDVVKQVADLGLDSRSALEFIEREKLIYLLIFGGMTCVAGVALLVAALGIANTMLMSVLERTREIGIMKSVGADNRHLMFVFLVEGGIIGTFGGLVGLLLAWSASFPGDAWVRSMVMRDIKIELKESLFVFPPSIALTVVAFTLLVTILAAVYPARHAARIDPVKALRHE